MARENYNSIYKLLYKDNKSMFSYEELVYISIKYKLDKINEFLNLYFIEITKEKTFNEFIKLCKKLRKIIDEELFIQIHELAYCYEQEFIKGILKQEEYNSVIENEYGYISCLFLIKICESTYINGIKFRDYSAKVNMIELYNSSCKGIIQDESCEQVIARINDMPVGLLGEKESKKLFKDLTSLDKNINPFITNFTKFSLMYLLDKDTFSSIVPKPNLSYIINNIILYGRKDNVTNMIDIMSDSLIETLKTRKFILPKSGINIKDIEYYDFKELYIKEYIRENGDAIIEAYCKVFDSGMMMDMPVFINLTKNYVIKTNGLGIDVINFLIMFYECDIIYKDVENEFIAFIDSRDRTRMVRGSNIRLMKNIGFRISNNEHNYTGRKNNKSKDLIRKKIRINTFVKKLPMGYNASDKAKELAKKYCIKLRDGYTIVESFEKEVNIRGK